MADGSLSRRELLRRSGGAGALLALPALATAADAAAATAPAAGRRAGRPDVYGAIGVRPLINARGTFTIISGSTMLPEVRAAMDAASAPLRASRRAGRGDRRPPGRADQGRMGPGHVGLLGRR